MKESRHMVPPFFFLSLFSSPRPPACLALSILCDATGKRCCIPLQRHPSIAKKKEKRRNSCDCATAHLFLDIKTYLTKTTQRRRSKMGFGGIFRSHVCGFSLQTKSRRAGEKGRERRERVWKRQRGWSSSIQKHLAASCFVSLALCRKSPTG